MTLADEVKARFGEAWLVELTNPQAPGFTTIDNARLNAACSDTIARFSTYAAATFDEANPVHVAVAVEGVIAVLLSRLGTQSDDARRWMEAFETGLKRLALVDHRDYVSPSVVAESPRMPRSAGRYVIPGRPNRISQESDE